MRSRIEMMPTTPPVSTTTMCWKLPLVIASAARLSGRRVAPPGYGQGGFFSDHSSGRSLNSSSHSPKFHSGRKPST